MSTIYRGCSLSVFYSSRRRHTRCALVTGVQTCALPLMCHDRLRHPYDVEDVCTMVRKVYRDEVVFHEGDGEIAPGVSVHHIGGHAKGLMSVRVNTRRGQVVLASDAAHLYANMEQQRPFPILYNLGDMLEGWKKQIGRAHV